MNKILRADHCAFVASFIRELITSLEETEADSKLKLIYLADETQRLNRS